MTIHTSVCTAVILIATVTTRADDDPARFAHTEVPNCGALSDVVSQSAGSGVRNGQVTHYQTASFDAVCQSAGVGQLDIQLADNQPAMVTYRFVKGSPDAWTLSGSDADAVVTAAIRAVCSCSAAPADEFGR